MSSMIVTSVKATEVREDSKFLSALDLDVDTGSILF